MGIKSLSLQMIPWCFHLMGNQASCVQLRHDHDPTLRTIQLIKSDGIVKIYHRPINVSDLMLEFPKHLVCRSDSFYIGQKIPALTEKDKLQLGHKYFLLPKHFFQSVLSFVTIASFSSNHSRSTPLLPASNSNSISSSSSSSSSLRPALDCSKNNAFMKKAATSCQPFIIRKAPSGSLQIRVSDEFIWRLMQEGRIKDDDDEDQNSSARPKGRICTTDQLQKDYTLLVESRQDWKPKLETIRESKRRKLASFGIKRRKKSQSKGTQQKTSRVPEIPSSKSNSIVKTKGRKKGGSKI